LFTTERSYCFHELSNLLRPYPSNYALTHWIAEQAYDHDFEQLQWRMLPQGFPEYFLRHWERARGGQFVVGNSDHRRVPRLLPLLG
jgi:hypothetical protein